MANEDLPRIWILGGLTPDFAFDAVISEEHSSESTITDHPVETGMVISDHVYEQPNRLTIEAAVSDIAFKPGDPTSDDPFASSTSRSAKAFDLLLKVKKAAEPFSVQTGLKLYDNMLIEHLGTRQDKDTSSALIFRAELKQVTITSTRTVTVPPRKPGKTARKGAPKTDNGTQSATPPEPAKVDSIALSLGKASGFLQGIGLTP